MEQWSRSLPSCRLAELLCSVKYVVGLNKVTIVTLKDFVDGVAEVCGDLCC